MYSLVFTERTFFQPLMHEKTSTNIGQIWKKRPLHWTQDHILINILNN